MPRNANQSKQSNYSLEALSQGDFVTVQDFPFGSSKSFTISFWVNGSNFLIGSTKSLIGTEYYTNTSPSTQFGFALNFQNGRIQFYSSPINSSRINNFYTANNILINNEWNHIVLRYNYGTDYRIYHNNTLKAVYDSNWSGFSQADVEVQYNTQTLWMYRGYYENYNLIGKMAEFSFFGYALSDTAAAAGDTATGQVAAIYGDGSSIPNPMSFSNPPIAYYPLGTSAWNGQYLAENNAIGDYVFDFIPNDAVQSNFTLFNGASEACISAWFKTNDQQSGKCLFSSPFAPGNNRFDLYLQSAGFTSYLKTVTSVTGLSSSTINYYDDKWHNVIVTYDGVNHKIYYDGDEVATAARSGVLADSTYNKIEIGRFGNTHSNNVDAEISNVLAWTKGLTPTEVETLYNYGSPIQTLANIPQSSNLKAWYKLDATEIYNSTSTEWKVNNATAEYKSSTFVDGLVGQATGYVQVGSYDALAGAQAGSWSFWYNTKSTAGRTKNCSWLVGPTNWIQPSGTVWRGNAEFTLNTSNGLQRTSVSASYSRRIFLDASDASSLNEWVHVVGTYDGSNLRVYVNGEQKGLVNEAGANVVDFPATGTITTGNIQIGSGSNLVYFLSAMYSNLSIWDKALTLSEINEIYNSGQPKSLSSHTAASNLISWWTLDNFTTGLVDSIGGYNASLVGSDSHVSPGTVSILNGESIGMSQSNLVQSDLQTVAPYSKYALAFDGSLDTVLLGNAPIVTGVFTMSMWIKRTSTTSPGSHTYQSLFAKDDISSNRVYSTFFNTSTGVLSFWVSSSGSYNSGFRVDTSTAINDTEWHNVVFINNGTNVKNQVYVDGAEASYATQGTGVSSLHSSTINSTACGLEYLGSNYFYGSVSNISMWTSAFSASQVIEIYNEGLPSNLNSHSAVSSLASWWQLGDNSSFDGSNWICVNEVASNDGVTRSTPVGALTNGVGTTANGVSSGMSEGSLVGDAPYNTGNAISSGMPATARGTDVPS